VTSYAQSGAIVTVLKISNREARHMWLSVNGLAQPPAPQDTIAHIHALGFVQLDTIQVVSRAHHHILWSRDQSYREPVMDDLLGTPHERKGWAIIVVRGRFER
jgi:uncharacterized protein YcaQ